MQKQQAADSGNTTIEASLEGLPRYLTRREVADLLRCNPDHVTKLVQAGELDAIQRKPKPGHTRRGIPIKIPRASVRQYLEGSLR